MEGAGFTTNVSRPVTLVNRNVQNNSQAANQGPRAAALSNATATAPPPSTAVATPGSAPAAPVGGTTVPTGSPAVRTAPAAPAAQQIGSVAAAIAMATSGVFFAQVGSAAAVATGKKSSDVTGKDEVSDRAKSTEADEKNNLALKDSNSETGNEAGEISGANAANAPAA